MAAKCLDCKKSLVEGEEGPLCTECGQGGEMILPIDFVIMSDQRKKAVNARER
jgi:hypothetical protein